MVITIYNSITNFWESLDMFSWKSFNLCHIYSYILSIFDAVRSWNFLFCSFYCSLLVYRCAAFCILILYPETLLNSDSFGFSEADNHTWKFCQLCFLLCSPSPFYFFSFLIAQCRNFSKLFTGNVNGKPPCLIQF